jgi:hypothetical protein
MGTPHIDRKPAECNDIDVIYEADTVTVNPWELC